MNYTSIIIDTVAKLRTNDDLYNVNLYYIALAKTSTTLQKHINDVVYHEIALAFRTKLLNNCGYTHGNYFETYKDLRNDAFSQLLCARDRLMDYCDDQNIDYMKLFE